MPDPGLFCADLAALGRPYCQDLGPIFSLYGPRPWLIRYMYLRESRLVKPHEGVANGTWKIQGLGNFCSDLEISEAF